MGQSSERWALLSQIPCVVCLRATLSCITGKCVPKRAFSSVDLPELWAPRIATRWYALSRIPHSPQISPSISSLTKKCVEGRGHVSDKLLVIGLVLIYQLDLVHPFLWINCPSPRKTNRTAVISWAVAGPEPLQALATHAANDNPATWLDSVRKVSITDADSIHWRSHMGSSGAPEKVTFLMTSISIGINYWQRF